MNRDSHIQIILPHLSDTGRRIDDIIADLELFSVLLIKWQRIQNLVSRETLANAWSRHFADSLQLLRLIRPTDLVFLDLGSGGGFPALPLAIALKGTPAEFILVEPNARKVSFLRTVGRDLGLNLRVEGRRSEAIDSRETPKVDVITARALAGLPQLCDMAMPFFSPGTRAIFHKGREYVEELATAGAQWHFNVLLTPSAIDTNGVLIELSDLRPIKGR